MDHLIESASYMAHGYCLLWKPWLVTLHAGSDILIAGSYFAIPAAIWVFLRRRRDLDLQHLAILFAAFIFLCGLTHLIQLLTLWWPIYETQGVVKFATAVVSVITAILIFPLIPKAVAIPRPSELQSVISSLHDEVASHQQTLAELVAARDGLERRVQERTAELQAAKARFEALVLASAQVVWSTSPSGEVLNDSPSWRQFTGQSFDEWKGYGWLDALHPGDRERTREAWNNAVTRNEPYNIDYRVRHADGDYRWTTARAVPLKDESGQVSEWVGMNEDISERKRQEEQLRIVMRELSHRTKNLLAVIQSIARRTFKEDTNKDDVDAFNQRLHGLSVSHDLLVKGDWSGTTMMDLVRAHLEPFWVDPTEKVSVEGPMLWLKSEAAQNLGLALHELATNAAKYGAFKGDGSQLNVSWRIESDGQKETVVLSWQEPESRPAPNLRQNSFGRLLLEGLVASSVSGTSTYTLDDTGISWVLKAPVSQLSGPAADASAPSLVG